jgi:Zn-dependent protease with chaperone function
VTSEVPGRTADGGTCHVFHAFEAAFAIDLERAEAFLRAHDGTRTGLAGGGRNVGGEDFEPRPLRTSVPVATVTAAGIASIATAHVTVFDFGAISVRIDFPLAGSVEALTGLSRALVGNAALRDAARDAAGRVLAEILPACQRPALSEHGEDYAVFSLPPVAGGPRAGLPDALMARILRAEEGALGPDEVRDAVASVVGYSTDDLAVVDWNAAILVDPSPGDALAVLEFANVELTEMRWLDGRLDRALDEAVRAAADSLRGPRVLGIRVLHHARRIAEMQVDAVALYESVNNALKLLGDQWLARLHQAAVRRMHVDDWERSILRKSEALDSIYGKIRDRQVQVRAELLEWIIIALIAVEIVLFVAGCTTVSGTNRSQLNMVSVERERELGEEAYAEMLGAKGVKRLTSGPDWDRVQRIADRIEDAAQRLHPRATAGFEWEWAVVDDEKTVNAWALPGGKSAVYTGMLRMARTDDELAVVMGHEAAHAIARHAGERISGDILVQGAMQGTAVALGDMSPGTHRATMAALGLGSNVGVLLPWSRMQESEADEIGLFIAADAGYDPQAAIPLWERMAGQSGAPAEFLSTHPSESTRIQRLRKLMPRAMAIRAAADARSE